VLGGSILQHAVQDAAPVEPGGDGGSRREAACEGVRGHEKEGRPRRRELRS
jgi:hypothetical protein